MTQSLEDYLETIYVLNKGQKVVRVKEISERMGVKKPSVINALRELKKQDMVRQERYGFIELTAPGRSKALVILKKHEVLRDFLMRVLGVSAKNADEDACSMEHILSVETLGKIGNMVRQTKKKQAGRSGV